MLSTAKSAIVGFSQVVQFFAPPTNPANAPRTENAERVQIELFTPSMKVQTVLHKCHSR